MDAALDAEKPIGISERELRLLIIDDDVVDRMAVRRAMSQSSPHATIEEAGTCQDARALIGQRAYDCIFLDYMLPDGSGLDVLQGTRAAGVRTPIVVLTSQGDEAIAVEMMQAGAQDYLPKSAADPDRLGRALRQALALFRAERLVMEAEIERQRLLVLEQEARSEAEAAQRRLAFLVEASALASATLDYGATLENVARLAVPNLADWCFIDVDSDTGGFERVAVAHRAPADAPLAARFRRRFERAPDSAASPRPAMSQALVDVPDWHLVGLAHDAADLDALRQLCPRAWISVPLVARGRTMGAMQLILTSSGRSYSAEDVAFAEEVARRVALAVDNARLYQEVRTAEALLRHQLAFTGAIARSLGEGVCALDPEGRIQFVNPAAEAMLGGAPSELVGRPLINVLKEEPPRIAAALQHGEAVRADDAVFLRVDGSRLPVAYTVAPIQSPSGPPGVVVTFHDISARKRAEAELESSRRQIAETEKLSALGTLVSGVAHELRTPLTYMANNVFLMQAHLDRMERENPSIAPLVAEARRFGENALEGAERINALVRDLRPFAQGDSSRRQAAALHEVAAGAVELFRATYRGKVVVETDLRPTRPSLMNKGEVQRVIINLLVNAAEATPGGGILRMATRATPEGALAEVEDHGTGISPEIAPRIFDPFFTTKNDGTGLGLSITRRIVESHGGKLGYVTALGRGTTFSFTLPVLEAS